MTAGPSISGQPRWAQSWAVQGRSTEINAGGQYAPRIVVWNKVSSASAQIWTTGIDPADWDIYLKRIVWFLETETMAADTSPALTYYYSLFPVTGLTGT